METNLMLAKAITVAAASFATKLDKGGHPYILHCLKVMEYLHTHDDELKCIAVLHDIVEDTEMTYEELQEMGFTKPFEGQHPRLK